MQKVEFSYWLPEKLSITDINFCIILSGDLNLINDERWQNFAKKSNSLLIGTFFIGSKKIKESGEEYDSSDYCYVVNSGSGQILINYIESLGINLSKTKLLLSTVNAS